MPNVDSVCILYDLFQKITKSVLHLLDFNRTLLAYGVESHLAGSSLFSTFCCPHVFFSSHVVCCEARLLSFPTEYSVSVHDGCGRGPVFSVTCMLCGR